VCLGGGGVTKSVCVYIYIQYDTPTHWRTGKERADRAGAKSAGAGTFRDDTGFDFLRKLWGRMHTNDTNDSVI